MDSLRLLREGIRLDVLFAVAVLAACFAAFYHRWPIWEDQAIFHYLAWGLEHGLVPYRDMIDINWPGTMLVHVAARAISGSEPFGLRLVDSLFALLLCVTTSALLSAYGVARPVRLLGIIAYLSAYFATGFASTAQRESFMFPLVTVGLTACLTHHKRATPLPAWAWLGAGALTSLGLWVKPTFGPVVVVAVGVMLAISARRGATAWRHAMAMLAGALATTALMLVFIFVWCDPHGFYRWGIEFAFGPYKSFPWSRRFGLLGQNLYASPLPWSTALALVGALAWVVACVRGRATAAPLGARSGDVSIALGSVVVIGTTIMLQGRTHYQFHPLRWALAFAGCMLLTAAVPHVGLPKLSRAAAISCGVLVALELLIRPAGLIARPRGTVLAEILKPRLAPSDQVVTFGFSPTFLSSIERKTPFPHLAGIGLFVVAVGDRSYEVEIGEAYAAAAEHPEVKVIMIQRLSWSIFGWDPTVPMVNSHDVAYEFLPPERLKELGFVLVSRKPYFDLYIRGATQADIDELAPALLATESVDS